MIEPLAKRVADLGWHIQIHMRADQIVENAALLEGLPTTVVFDHLGRLPQPAPLEHAAFGIIRRMMDKGSTWMKLSGAYMDTNSGAPTYADKLAVAQAYIKAAPERVVWGSDWPHPTEKPEHKPNDATLFDLLTAWAPDAAQRQRILVSNPEALYGFAKTAQTMNGNGRRTMLRIALAAAAALFTSAALAQPAVQPPMARAAADRLGQGRDQGDRSRQQDLHADRRGRQHHVRGRQRRHHHGGRAVRAALRQDQGGDQGDLAAADPVYGQHAFPRRPHRRQRELRQGWRDHRGARQSARPPRGRHRVGHDRRARGAARRPKRCRSRPTWAARSRSRPAAARRSSRISPTRTPTATPGSISPTPTCCRPATPSTRSSATRTSTT